MLCHLIRRKIAGKVAAARDAAVCRAERIQTMSVNPKVRAVRATASGLQRSFLGGEVCRVDEGQKDAAQGGIAAGRVVPLLERVDAAS